MDYFILIYGPALISDFGSKSLYEQLYVSSRAMCKFWTGALFTLVCV